MLDKEFSCNDSYLLILFGEIKPDPKVFDNSLLIKKKDIRVVITRVSFPFQSIALSTSLNEMEIVP